jgi:hypothetical protein
MIGKPRCRRTDAYRSRVPGGIQALKDESLSVWMRAARSETGSPTISVFHIELRRRVYECLVDCSGLLDDRLVMVIDGMPRYAHQRAER